MRMKKLSDLWRSFSMTRISATPTAMTPNQELRTLWDEISTKVLNESG